MPPKKRATTVSPKKGAKAVEEAEMAAMEDIESEDNEAAEEEKKAPAASSTPTTSPTRRSKRRGGGVEEEASPAVVDEQQEAPPLSEAATDDGDDEAPPTLPPAVDEDQGEEEIVETREEEEDAVPPSEPPPPQLHAVAKKDPATPARSTAVISIKSSVSTPFLSPAASHRDPSMMTPNRSMVPRLKMDHEPSEDVRRAQAAEDDRERDVKPARKPPALRRPTSPARTRGFTSAATLSATMKESKQRLKMGKRELVKEEGESSMTATATADATETEELVDVETEGETVTDGKGGCEVAGGGNACAHCGVRFPLHLEMVEHQLNAHKKEAGHQRERGGTLMCAHPHCGLALKDMHHQLAHLAGYHNQIQYRIRQQHFSSEEAFEAWKADSEARAKSAYIARTEELEVEPGVVELELYCECSEEWRNADKSKSMAPMLACPAHFTVRLDRNKDKVLVIGCSSHLGHLKKPNWSVYEPVEHHHTQLGMKKGVGLGGGGVPVTTKTSKCHLCNEWFRSRTALTLHRRNAHPDHIRTATIACGEPTCDVVTDTMLSLCEHVADAHKREDLTVEEYRFNSIQDFELWKERMEADTMSYYTKVSGRQRAAPSGPNSDCFFRYYQCHLSGFNQRPSQKNNQDDMERIKMRNRGTKKMGRFCTAFMNIKINDGDGSVLLKGCLGHFGHECDIRRVPMPNSLRTEIVELLQKGVTEDDVLSIIKNKASAHDRAAYLQKYEVKNIVKKLIKESNGAIFYKYDDEIEEMGMEDMEAEWTEMKRPFSSAMYRSMMQHPKRVRMGSFALQFGNQPPRKRRLVYTRQPGDESMHDGEEYYESVVEEMATDMDEHVTYLDEVEIDASSSHLHMVEEGVEQHEEIGMEQQHHEMQDEMANEASTSSSSAAHLLAHHRRRKQPAILQQQHMIHHHHQHPQLQERQERHIPGGSSMQQQLRMPLLKDGSERIPIMDRDHQIQFDIHNIRQKIMYMTNQVKRCKDVDLREQMVAEIHELERRMARIIPQTGAARLDQSLPLGPFGRRDGDEEEEEEEQYYEEEMVVDDDGEGGHYYMEEEEEEELEEEDEGGRPGPSSMVQQRRGVVQRRDYGHHQVIYQDVSSPGVEVDVEDLDGLEDAEVIDQMG